MKTLTSNDIHKLRRGDKLRVNDDNLAFGYLTIGKIFTFDRADKSGAEIYVQENRLSWRIERFELVPRVSKRDARGRFVSVKPAPVKTRVKPTALRFGALYAVKRKRGYQIAHLRTTAHEDFLVFSRHKKPFLARRDQVALANNEEVAAYLDEAKAAKS